MCGGEHTREKLWGGKRKTNVIKLIRFVRGAALARRGEAACFLALSLLENHKMADPVANLDRSAFVAFVQPFSTLLRTITLYHFSLLFFFFSGLRKNDFILVSPIESDPLVVSNTRSSMIFHEFKTQLLISIGLALDLWNSLLLKATLFFLTIFFFFKIIQAFLTEKDLSIESDFLRK